MAFESGLPAGKRATALPVGIEGQGADPRSLERAQKSEGLDVALCRRPAIA
jgi:hypothetical protein